MKKSKSMFPTLASISAKYGIHRNSISAWFSQPGAPAKASYGYDPAAVKDWIESCAKTDATLAKVDPDYAAAKLSEILEKVRRLKMANDLKERVLIPRSELEREVREMATAVQGVLYGQIDSLAVKLAGQTTTACHSIMTAWCDEAVGKLSRGESK